ncbi:MAG: hypothetical protein UW23_C0001G0053, partial [Candidatus Collierbacteria bacterium GW2011_GWA1_44_12]
GGTGVGSDPRTGHDNGRCVYSLHGEGAEIGGVNKIGSVDIITSHVVAESISGIVCPGRSIGNGTRGGEVTSSIGDRSHTIYYSEWVIGNGFDGVAKSRTCGDT